MASLIERYVWDVARHLPENEREDVQRELTSNIFDMLGDDAGDEQVKQVLYSLGPPAKLAEDYRQNPRYLISPALYGDYVRALKTWVPVIGVILLAMGAVLGAIDAIGEGMAEASVFVKAALSQGLSFGISGAFQALVWITVGFVIYERAGQKKAPAQAWKVEDLPEATESDKGRIPLSDSVVELVILVVFSIFAVLVCSGALPMAFSLMRQGVRVEHLFSASFMAVCIPVILIGAIAGGLECVIKIAQQRYTPLVCAAVALDSVVSIASMLYLFTRPEIFHPDFLAFVNAVEWGSHDLMRFMGNTVQNPVLLIIGAIVVIASVAQLAKAVWRTARAGR